MPPLRPRFPTRRREQPAAPMRRKELLGVPDDPSITCEIDPNTSYWEGVGKEVQRAFFYENGEECASGYFILPDGANGGRTFNAYSR